MSNKFFLHSLADCQSHSIGVDTRIWQFVVILPNAIIGSNCNICAHVLIENSVVLGDNVTVKSGVQLWDGLVVGDNVFIGPNVSFCNDKYPFSGRHFDSPLSTVIESNVSIGAGSVILPGLTIGFGSTIGAGSVVTKSIPPYSVAFGNPASVRSS